MATDKRCLCGQQAGRRHDHNCPYPCYTRGGLAAERWAKEREALEKSRATSTWQGDLFGGPSTSTAKQRELFGGDE